MRTTPPIQVDKMDIVQLRSWAGSRTDRRLAQRARIVLLSADGLGPTAVARELSCTRQTVMSWRERYRTLGVTGLLDATRSGRPTSVNPTDILLRTLDPPPVGFQRWSSRLLGAELGISNASVASAWREWGIRPTTHGGWRLDTDPALDTDVTRVLGLHVVAGSGAIVLERGRPVPGDRIPVARRQDVGELPDHGDPSCFPDFEDGAIAFLRSLPPGGARHPRVIIVAGASPWWRRLDRRRGQTIHVAGPGRPWARLVRVTSLMAGAHPRGTTSVAHLCAALHGCDPDAAFSWSELERRLEPNPPR
ncbi:hypothetical protein GCM10009836_48290 [Pseudonocardia ailaonensis]|uniref:Transposase n=1 Tax=Pseudonocardia ailaonensis TaxID=367279 RepID=A0ABN2NC11_9PSEU